MDLFEYETGKAILFTKGSNGKLYLVYDNLLKKPILIKYLKNTSESSEADIHLTLSHPLVIKIYWSLRLRNNDLLLGLEFNNFLSLEDYITHKEYFSEKDIFKIFSQLVDVIKYLHKNDIMHGDIKTDNILINPNFDIKLCDFGFSKKLSKNKLIDIAKGSENYYPPEIIYSKYYDGKKIDIWCLGIVLYTLFIGTPPDRTEIHSVIFSKDIINIPDLFFMMDNILHYDNHLRWNIIEIETCRWYLNMKDKYFDLYI